MKITFTNKKTANHMGHMSNLVRRLALALTLNESSVIKDAGKKKTTYSWSIGVKPEWMIRLDTSTGVWEVTCLRADAGDISPDHFKNTYFGCLVSKTQTPNLIS